MTEPLRFPEKYFELFPQTQRLATETLMNALHLARLVEDAYERIARTEGLSTSGVETLRLLVLADGPLTPAELASSEFLSTATMTTVLATLERRGLVQRTPHPSDGRKVLMSAAGEAGEVLARIMDRYLSLGHELMTTLSDKELSKLQHLIVRLLAKVDDVNCSPPPVPPEGSVSPEGDQPRPRRASARARSASASGTSPARRRSLA